MKRKAFVVLATALMVAMVLPAGAAPPSEVNIVVETTFGAPSPFVASGPAVDDGLICASGIVIDDFSSVTGLSRTGFNFHGIKHFTCDDGTGEFFVNLNARIHFRKGTTFNWNVIGGTGDYENLHGAGSGDGIQGEPCGTSACVLDLYDGGLHID